MLSWPNAVALAAGDYLGLNGRLYMATEDVVASGTGTATIPIGPLLRVVASISEPLVLTAPTVPMRLVSDNEAANPARPLHRCDDSPRGGAAVSDCFGTHPFVTR